MRRRDLIATNLVCLVILLIALVVGWTEAAAFGLGVLVVLDAIVLIRGRKSGG